MTKLSKAIKVNKLRVTVQTKVMIRTKQNYPLLPLTLGTVYLTAVKLLSY